MNSKNITAKIVDIRSNKHVRGKPKTAVMSVAVTKNVSMKYVFDNGDFSATEGKTWSDVTIGLKTNIKFALCNTN